MSEPVYVAITEMKHYFGTDLFKIGLVLQLIKDEGNPHDGEAIRAEIPPIGKVGYVANSTCTVPRGCRSAGGIYYTFEKLTLAKVVFVIRDTVIVELQPNVAEWQTVYINEQVDYSNWNWPSSGELKVPIRCVVEG